MKTKCLFLSVALWFTCVYSSVAQSAVSKKASESVSSYIKVNNTAQLITLLNDPVDLTLPNSDNSYSKAQASVILNKFFKENPVKSYSIYQSGKSVDGAVFVIGRYESTNGKKYRVYYLIKEFSGNPLIYLLEFELE